MAHPKQRRRRPRRRLFFELRYRLGEFCLRGLVLLLPGIPKWLLWLFTAAGARVSFLLLRKYRVRMEENLSRVMGPETLAPEERREIVRRTWRNFARGFYETTAALCSPAREIATASTVRGEEHLKRALEKGKGVIGVSAHLGNFTLIGARLAASGYRFNVVVKQPRDLRLANLIDDYRARIGIQTISARPRRETARKILKALRKNEVVLLIADEFKSGGVKVKFLGRIARAPRGPATLALRTGAAVVPMFMVRDGEDRLTLHVHPEIELPATGDLEKDVAVSVARISSSLEEAILKYPDQWSWLGFGENGRVTAGPEAESEKTASRPLE
jgi:KDO2-lipid IV(A) lauroyltransferase